VAETRFGGADAAFREAASITVANVHALAIVAAETSIRATLCSIRVITRVAAGWGKPAKILSTHSAVPLPVLHGILFLLVDRREFGAEEISVSGKSHGQRF
jgi:hypothetical protein